MDINIHLAAFRRCQMIEESDAIEIATRFLKARQELSTGFQRRIYVSEEQIWACCFEKQIRQEQSMLPESLLSK